LNKRSKTVEIFQQCCKKTALAMTLFVGDRPFWTGFAVIQWVMLQALERYEFWIGCLRQVSIISKGLA
jgi:hypothetical protein